MTKRLLQTLKRFSHDAAITELNLIHNKNMKISYNSLLYWDIITAYPGKYTASNIADMLKVARPAVTQKINELEKTGYIYRKQHNTDKRVYFLYPVKERQNDFRIEDEHVIQKFITKYSSEDILKFCNMMDNMGDLYLEQYLGEQNADSNK